MLIGVRNHKFVCVLKRNYGVSLSAPPATSPVPLGPCVHTPVGSFLSRIAFMCLGCVLPRSLLAVKVARCKVARSL